MTWKDITIGHKFNARNVNYRVKEEWVQYASRITCLETLAAAQSLGLEDSLAAPLLRNDVPESTHNAHNKKQYTNQNLVTMKIVLKDSTCHYENMGSRIT